MPRTLKQYYRRILVGLGLFDEGAFRLVIDRIYPDDTFIVSYPKSGNTWMRFLLAHILSPGKKITFRNIDEVVPDVYTAKEILNRLPPPHYIKAHDPWFHYYPKTIYLVRDYRDALVSYYHYQQALGSFTGSLAEFVQKIDTLHPFGSWANHVESALRFAESHPDRLLPVRYEDLLSQPEKELTRVMEFCGLHSERPLEEVIAQCRFEKLREDETRNGSAFMDQSRAHFFRKGQKGGWKEELSQADLDAAPDAERVKKLLQQLGYIN